MVSTRYASLVETGERRGLAARLHKLYQVR
jgi:hypothetical protein